MRFCNRLIGTCVYSFLTSCQFLTGLFILICGIQNWKFSSRLHQISHGIWGGVFIMLSSCHNLACTIAETRVLEITRLITDVVVSFFVLPMVNVFFALEYISDSYYNHFSDNFYCEGCFSMQWHSQIYEFLDTNSSINAILEKQPYEFYSHVVATLKCNDLVVAQLCHPNVQAAVFDFCGFMACFMLLFFFSVPVNIGKAYWLGYSGRSKRGRIHSIEAIANDHPANMRQPSRRHKHQ